MALRDIEKADRFLKDCSQWACPPSDVGAWIVERVDPFLIGWPIARPRADLAALVLVQVANFIGLEPVPVLIAGPLDRDGVFVAADPDPRRLEILLGHGRLSAFGRVRSRIKLRSNSVIAANTCTAAGPPGVVVWSSVNDRRPRGSAAGGKRAAEPCSDPRKRLGRRTRPGNVSPG
jgi:hypothetical protein